jgi:hypothetical protein
MPAWRDQIVNLSTLELPSAVRGQDNGKLPDHLLVVVDPNGARLLEPVARAYNMMKWNAAVDGIELRPTSRTDAYRTYDQQVTSFQIRYRRTNVSATDPRPTSDAKKWQGVWWDKLDNFATSATPGTSNHGWACAVDIANASATARLSWLENNAAWHGFLWEEPSEPWHLTYVYADATPPSLQPAPPPPAVLPVLKRGDTGDYVLWAQTLLRDRAGQNIAVDGQFGGQTELAVRNVQTVVHFSHPEFAINGMVDHPTWWVLGSLPAPAVAA